MKNTRNVLEKQIITDISNFDTTILSEILSLLTDEQVFNSLSDKNQEGLNFHQLKGGEYIKALVDTRGVSNSYNTPERIDIKKGTILECPNSGTRMGDAFASLVSGNAVKHCRGYNEGEKQELKPSVPRGIRAIVGLSGGYNSAPYSLGQIDLRVWEIIKNN